jgi:hypothetical protein
VKRVAMSCDVSVISVRLKGVPRLSQVEGLASLRGYGKIAQ